MLSKNVFFDCMDKMFVFYPNWNVKLDDEVVAKNWYEMFKTVSDEDFEMMVRNYISHERFHPTVAGLMSYKPSREGKSVELTEDDY